MSPRTIFNARRPICYVCCKEILYDAVYICQDKYRHKKCKPMSDSWMRSKISEKSELKEIIKKLENGGKKK